MKKYKYLSKENKIKTKKDFKNTKEGKEKINRLNRLGIYGILGLPCSIYFILTSESLSTLIIAYILLFLSPIYLICSYFLRIKCYDNYLNKK